MHFIAEISDKLPTHTSNFLIFIPYLVMAVINFYLISRFRYMGILLGIASLYLAWDEATYILSSQEWNFKLAILNELGILYFLQYCFGSYLPMIGVVIGLLANKRLRYSYRFNEICCTNCGYCLKGNNSCCCPECGTAFDPVLLNKLQIEEPVERR
ncbi:MAG: hypothetical protein HJJLKODD_00701 [Phycisphaerae bacterium]|nr:hypothetical protein [Phycisphaerae bacterium]